MGSLSAVDSPLVYPTARRDESVIDYYHGVPVPDPYRWLEDGESEESKEFVRKQVELTECVLKTCETREKLKLKLNEAFQFERYRIPFRRGNYLFFFHNHGLQPQDVLFIQEGLEGEAKVLLDPNELSMEGTVSLSILAVSENAEYMAYGLSTSGSDWITLKLMHIQDRLILPDTISWVKFSGISWTHDSRGFFYSRFPAPKGNIRDAGTETNINLNHELYYHVLGTNQSQDILCWKDPQHPKYRFYTKITDDGKYLLVNIGETCEDVNKLYYLNLSTLTNNLRDAQTNNGLLPFTKLIDDLDALYEYVANDDSVFTFLTNKNAPKRKLVRVDLNEPSTWTDVIAESEKDVLVTAQGVNQNQLIVCYLSDVKHVVHIRDLQTGSLLQPLPIDIGTVTISAHRKHSIAFIGFTNFLTFNTVYQCDLLGADIPDLKIFREVSVPEFDRSLFKVDQVFVPSKDGTKIPMFIVGKKDMVLDRSNPCLLFAYGAFSISLTPCFSVIRTILLRHLDVVFCLANIRGGGEYGEEWHKAGSLDKKQNCFDDFISTAEFLVSNGYTQPSKLCIEGRSNGGLLIGACINQRPDLFGCALAHVGVMDMLRFHKFTIGHAWTCDFGCSDNEEDFHWLIKYSPLHNVKRPWENSGGGYIQYPATMLLTADHDDRVVPLHSLKLLATMQHTLCSSLKNSPQTNPIIGRIECKAGHGCGRPIQKEIDEAADRYSFMAKIMNASWID